LDKGVRILDRYCITELMTSDAAYPTQGRVIGAFAFNALTGQCLAFHAKTTILATGQISMKGIHHVDNDTGDGVAMGWRVGARLSDLEFSFGGTFVTVMKRYNLGSYNVAVAHGARLINRHGERFMAQYDPVRFERSELSRVVAAFVKELRDGRGPVYLDLRHCDASYWLDLEKMAMTSGKTVLLSDKIPDPKLNPLPIEATWNFWSGGRGGIDINLHCQSSTPGLYAAGATAKNPATGTHASAGAPTSFAMNSGYHAGEHAAQGALQSPHLPIPPGLIERLRSEALAPLQRAASQSTADTLHTDLAELGGSIIENMELNGERLEKLREKASHIKNTIAQTCAKHVHDLVKVHEARNIAENAWLIYASAADRTESREQFYRADYPYTDDEQWFCIHSITREGHGHRFERFPIDLEHQPLSNRAQKRKALSPIAAIFAGTYDPSDHE
jgi:aspartate oxidase